MSQEELVAALSERAGLSRQTVQEIIEEIARVWTDVLIRDGELSIETVGSFVVDHQAGRKGVNLETREILLIPPRDVVTFVPAQDLIRWSNRVA